MVVYAVCVELCLSNFAGGNLMLHHLHSTFTYSRLHELCVLWHGRVCVCVCLIEIRTVFRANVSPRECTCTHGGLHTVQSPCLILAAAAVAASTACNRPTFSADVINVHTHTHPHTLHAHSIVIKNSGRRVAHGVRERLSNMGEFDTRKKRDI